MRLASMHKCDKLASKADRALRPTTSQKKFFLPNLVSRARSLRSRAAPPPGAPRPPAAQKSGAPGWRWPVVPSTSTQLVYPPGMCGSTCTISRCEKVIEVRSHSDEQDSARPRPSHTAFPLTRRLRAETQGLLGYCQSFPLLPRGAPTPVIYTRGS